MSSKVALLKVDPKAETSEVYEAVNMALEMIGAPGEHCSKGDTVLVKPNFGNTTRQWNVSPSVACATIKVFSDWGCRVLVGEDPAVSQDESTIYALYKLFEIASESGAEVVSLRHGPHELVKVPGSGYFEAIEVSKYALDATLVISLAKMKAANITHVSLSLKNMKGVLSPQWKRKLHCDGLNQGIVDLNRVVRPGLAIVDGIEAADMSSRTVKPVGLILAGDDCVAVDAISTRIMGLDPRKVDHIVLAEKANLGTADFSRIEILGEKLEDFEGKFTFSPPANPFELAAESGGRIRIIQGNPCSACLNEVGWALGSFKDHLKEFEDLVIVVGPNATLPETGGQFVLVGNCVKRYQAEGIYVHGCPPCDYSPAGTGSLKEALSKALSQGC